MAATERHSCPETRRTALRRREGRSGALWCGQRVCWGAAGASVPALVHQGAGRILTGAERATPTALRSGPTSSLWAPCQPRVLARVSQPASARVSRVAAAADRALETAAAVDGLAPPGQRHIATISSTPTAGSRRMDFAAAPLVTGEGSSPLRAMSRSQQRAALTINHRPRP